ncbi:MAG: DUF3486 family protein [Desulfobacteraceae bacterium]|jgi:hypothetical protein
MRRHPRITLKILQLPPNVKKQVDNMLKKEGSEYCSYEKISDWLKSQGYMVGKNSIHRYVLSLEGNKHSIDSRKVRSIKDHIKKKINTVGLPENERKFYSLLNELTEHFESALKDKSVLKEEDTIK